MTEPLNITIDRLSERYDTLKKRCESVDTQCKEDIRALLTTIRELRTIGITLETPPYCKPKIVEHVGERYRIRYVPYRGENCTVDVRKTLLNGGVLRTQDDWLREYSHGTIGQIGIPDTELYFALIDTLNKNEKILDAQQREVCSEARESIRDDFAKHWVMTSTRVHPNRTTHQYNTPHAIKKKSIKGENGYLTELPDGDIVAEILANTTATHLNNIVVEMTGKNMHIWRNISNGCALVLGLNYGGMKISTESSTDIKRSARGMEVYRSTDT